MKTAILITARLKSTRLPLKVIKPIKGRPMISHMIERLKLSRKADKIIVCTSPIEQDAPLVQIAEQEKVECFRGDPVDVLLRMKEAAEKYAVDVIVSCSADNPFVDNEYIDKLINYHLQNNNDYSNISGLPLGTFSHAISYNSLAKICDIKDESDTEVWGAYFTESGLFKCGTLVADPDYTWPELRLTVDYPEDFKFVTRIFDELYNPGEIFSLKNILKLCRTRNDLVEINASAVQKSGKPIKLKKGY